MLYIVNKSNDVLVDCIERASNDDVILLVENAIYSAIEAGSSVVFDKNIPVYALEPDMKARGIGRKQSHDFIQYVDYEGFVELVEKNNPVRSYF